MKKLLFSMFILASAMVSVESNASLLLEPYAGYYTGSITGTSSYSISGVGYGGRLGFQNLGFMVGADYLSGSWTGTINNVSTTYVPSDLGVFVGYDFPILLRIYGEYIAIASQQSTANGASNTATGTGYKLGVGYKFMPFLSVNFELLGHTFTKDNNGTLNPNTTEPMYGLAISLPFTI